MRDNELKAIAVRVFSNLKSVEIAKNPDTSDKVGMEIRDILLGFNSRKFMASALDVISSEMENNNTEESELLPLVITRTPIMTSNGQWFIEMDADDFTHYFAE